MGDRFVGDAGVSIFCFLLREQALTVLPVGSGWQKYSDQELVGSAMFRTPKMQMRLCLGTTVFGTSRFRPSSKNVALVGANKSPQFPVRPNRMSFSPWHTSKHNLSTRPYCGLP